MIHVYLDATKLTLSAHNFPARIIASDMASSFSFESHDTSAKTMENQDFQYFTPTFHLDALLCIVQSYQKTFFTDLLENSIAVSLRCDGSVDCKQVYKIYVLAKSVLKNGKTEELFLGAAEPQIHGAEGILEAIKTACNTTLNCLDAAKRIYSSPLHLWLPMEHPLTLDIKTDCGMWELFEKEKNSIDAIAIHPFVTFWCGVG